MRFEYRQVNEAGFLHETGDAEAAQALCAGWSQFDPILFAALWVDTDDADAIVRTEFLYSQDCIGGLAVKLGAGGFTEHRLCTTGVYLFSDSLEQGKAGG